MRHYSCLPCLPCVVNSTKMEVGSKILLLSAMVDMARTMQYYYHLTLSAIVPATQCHGNPLGNNSTSGEKIGYVHGPKEAIFICWRKLEKAATPAWNKRVPYQLEALGKLDIVSRGTK